MNTVAVFLINVLLVRLLGVAASGVFFYDITVLSFIILVLSLCLESGITYFASKENGIVSTVLIFILPWLLVQGAVAMLLLPLIHLTISQPLALLFILSNLAIIYISAIFYAQKKFISLNALTFCINLATMALLFFLGYINTSLAGGARTYQLVYIAGIALLAAVLMLTILAGKKAPSPVAIATVVKNIFSYSSVAFLSNVIFFLVIRVDYFFVQQYCSSEALSNYIQVSKFGQLLVLVPAIIGSIVFPYSAGDNGAFTLQKVQQLCRAITLVFIPVALLVLLTGYWVLPWVFGTGFSLMYAALLCYLPGFFALSIVTVLAAHLGGKKMLGTNLVAALTAIAIVAAGDVLLIPAGGINAAAAVSSVGYSACCIFLLWSYKTKFNCMAKDFFISDRNEIKMIVGYCKNLIFPSSSIAQ